MVIIEAQQNSQLNQNFIKCQVDFKVTIISMFIELKKPLEDEISILGKTGGKIRDTLWSEMKQL